MGIARNTDVVANRREQQAGWLPDWRLWVWTEGAPGERRLDDLLQECGHGPVLDWDVRHVRNLPGLYSVTLVAEDGRLLWDQFVWDAIPDRPRGVVVIPWRELPTGVHVGMQDEYRPSVPSDQGRGRRFQALPRGFVDELETSEAAARRELQEETGFAPVRLDDLGLVYGDTAFGSAPFAVVAAEIPDRTGQMGRTGEDEEIFAFILVPVREALGRAEDAHTLSALARFVGWIGTV